MAGKPITRARKREAALEALAEARRAQIEDARELAELTPPEFTGHRPPLPPPLDELPELPFEEIADTLSDSEREVALHELWPLATNAMRQVLADPDASASAKVAAARVVAVVKEKQLAAEASKLPTRIIFETAAYTPTP